VAPTIKPAGSAIKAAQEARHLALPVIAGGVVIAVLYYGRVIFVTSIIAVVIAFILEPFVALLVRVHLPRPMASFAVCTVALLLLYVAGMGAFTQFSSLYADLPQFGQRIGDMVDEVRQRVQGMEQQAYRLVLPGRQRQQEEERARERAAAAALARSRRSRVTAIPVPVPPPEEEPQRIPIGEYIYAHLNSFYRVILMLSFVPFLVYFMLSWHDHINRSFLQFFHGEARLAAARSLEGVAEMVRAFVVGNAVLGLLLASISSLVFWLMRLPYPMLVGPLSGFLSLVPYVGLPLAMLPPLFTALGPNTVEAYVLVIVTVAMLHLIALNLLYPKIVGSRVHLNPLVVTFSLMFWGYLWDAPGLLLAIPLTAGLKAVCDNVKGLRPIGKFLGD
jgi:predicted PurR-regulated permease PerM